MSPEKIDRKTKKEQKKIERKEIKKRLALDPIYNSARLTKWLVFFLLFGSLQSYILYKSVEEQYDWVFDEDDLYRYSSGNEGFFYEPAENELAEVEAKFAKDYLQVIHRFDMDQAVEGFQFSTLHDMQFIDTETTPTLLLLSDSHVMMLQDQDSNIQKLGDESHDWLAGLEAFREDENWYWAALDQKSNTVFVGNLEGEIVWEHAVSPEFQLTKQTTLYVQPTDEEYLILLADFSTAQFMAIDPFIGEKWLVAYPEYASELSSYDTIESIKLSTQAFHQDRLSFVFRQATIDYSHLEPTESGDPHYYIMDEQMEIVPVTHDRFLLIDPESGEMNGLLKNKIYYEEDSNYGYSKKNDFRTIIAIIQDQTQIQSGYQYYVGGEKEILYLREDQFIDSSTPSDQGFSEEMMMMGFGGEEDCSCIEDPEPLVGNRTINRTYLSDETIDLKSRREFGIESYGPTIGVDEKKYSNTSADGGVDQALVFNPKPSIRAIELNYGDDNNINWFVTFDGIGTGTILIPENAPFIFHDKRMSRLSDLFLHHTDKLNRNDINHFTSIKANNYRWLALSTDHELVVLKTGGVDVE